MAKNTVADWSTTASDNSDVGGINIGEGCAAANVNNALREMMAQLAAPTFSGNLTALGSNTFGNVGGSDTHEFFGVVTMNSQLRAQSGTGAAAPSIAFGTDTDTGFSHLSDADDTISVILDGSFLYRFETDADFTSIGIATRNKGDARWTQISSSERYKENVRSPEPRSLTADMVAMFEWGGELAEDDPKRGQTGYGLIAERVATQFPEAVIRNEQGQPEGINFGAVVAHLLLRIEELENA